MENNKPEWLIKAEEEQAKFNESKIGKMTDTQIKKSNDAIQFLKLEDSEEQRKRYLKAIEKHPNMQSNGGKERAKDFTSEYQAHAASCRKKENVLASMRKASINSAINKKIKTKKWKQELYDMITLEKFTVYDLEKYVCKFPNMKDLQMFRNYLRDKKMYEVVGIFDNGKPGPSPKLYKKVETK